MAADRLAVLDATAYTFAQLVALLQQAHYVSTSDERPTIAHLQTVLDEERQAFLACRHRVLASDVPAHLRADFT